MMYRTKKGMAPKIGNALVEAIKAFCFVVVFLSIFAPNALSWWLGF